MVFALRLPPRLDTLARAHSDYVGISLNALVCVALDAYIRGVSFVAPVPSPEALDLVHTVPPKADTGGKLPAKKQVKKVTFKDRQRAKDTMLNKIKQMPK